MESLLKDFEDMGYEVKVGWKEKQRKKDMSVAIKKLKDLGDENKINYVKKLSRYLQVNALGE